MIEIFFFLYIFILGTLSLVNLKNTKIVYWLLSAPLIIFTALRPLGLMRDDRAYKSIYEQVTTENISDLVFTLRDPLYYLTTYIGKFVWDDIRVLLVISAFALCLKLLILCKIAGRNRLLVLFMYACIYWQLHDLTQLRVSLSVLFFMFFLYLVSKGKKHNSVIALIISSLFHAQAIINLLLIKRINIKNKKHFALILAAFSILILIGLTINMAGLAPYLSAVVANETINHTFDSYLKMKASGVFDDAFRLPLALASSLIVYGLVVYELNGVKFKSLIAQEAMKSVCYAAILSWFFSSISDIQVRYYEYYLVAGLFLVGLIAKRSVSYYACFSLSLVYFVKFNVKWQVWDVDILNTWLGLV